MFSEAREILVCQGRCRHLIFPGERIMTVNGSTLCRECAGNVKVPA